MESFVPFIFWGIENTSMASVSGTFLLNAFIYLANEHVLDVRLAAFLVIKLNKIWQFICDSKFSRFSLRLFFTRKLKMILPVG